MVVRPWQKHSARHPEAKFTHGGNGQLVLSEETREVRRDLTIVRAGPGIARCTICDRTFSNDAKTRAGHITSRLHRKNLGLS